MDRFRALQYFISAAEDGSFSRAARRLDVSVPAMTRLVGVLEARLGTRLLDRSPQGLSLTVDGARYLETCRPLLDAIAAADEAISGAGARPQGTLVIAAPAYLSEHCLVPALPAFRTAHPDIQIELRGADRVNSPAAQSADVLLLYGWPDSRDWVRRRIAQTRMLVCASPDYWKRHAAPRSPQGLEQHECLLFRDQEGTVLDLWTYERGGERETAAVRGWLVSSHRDDLLRAALEGQGVARMSDLSIQDSLRDGHLVPALTDWDSRDAPPVNLLYRAGGRRPPRVKVFATFVAELFARLERERIPHASAHLNAERPAWYRRRRGRASAMALG